MAKKSMSEIAAELERERIKEGGAIDYDDLRKHLTDNAYLYYIHHRVGWSNNYLKEIRNTGYVLVVLVTGIAAKLYGIL